MESKEHNLQDKRCECCGYMTYQREHMSCIRAAKQAQQADPVARIKTVGGYPDDSRHELELLVKHGQLFDGQLLYAAQPPAVAVPDGYVLVPVEPTQAMVDAGFGRDDDNCKFWLHPAQAYRAMLAAAQKGGQ